MRKYRHVPEGPTVAQVLPGKLPVPFGGPLILGVFALGRLPSLGAQSQGHCPTQGHTGEVKWPSSSPLQCDPGGPSETSTMET